MLTWTSCGTNLEDPSNLDKLFHERLQAMHSMLGRRPKVKRGRMEGPVVGNNVDRRQLSLEKLSERPRWKGGWG